MKAWGPSIFGWWADLNHLFLPIYILRCSSSSRLDLIIGDITIITLSLPWLNIIPVVYLKRCLSSLIDYSQWSNMCKIEFYVCKLCIKVNCTCYSGSWKKINYADLRTPPFKIWTSYSTCTGLIRLIYINLH